MKLNEIARSFGVLGLTSFGGPVAHLGYFRREFVDHRSWLSDKAYADTVALSQFLPGPASSQVGMALGYYRGAWSGMALAWALFTLPSAVLLAALGLFVGGEGFDADEHGWIKGLLAAAVGIVLHAVVGMARSMANTWKTAGLAVAAGIAILLGAGTMIPLVIVIAGAIGVLILEAPPAAASEGVRRVSQFAATICLGTFIALLLVLWILGTTFGGFFARAWAYYQAGALVFGGGHVVLPLLEEEFVGQGWMAQSDFMAGYSAAQAVPGPLFTFASYLGAIDGGVLGAIFGTIMIFLPSALILVAGLHFWNRWRQLDWLRKAFAAINAAVVGLLGAAFIDPIAIHGINGVVSALMAVICFAMLWFKLPSWSVALFGAVAGLLLL